jgi:hypothetical protein
MDSSSLSRAIMSGGLWMGVIYGVSLATGNSVDLMNTALDAGIMSASAVGSDVLHSLIQRENTNISSAVVTGLYYAGIQRVVRGDTNYLVNAGFAGANDLAVSMWSDAQQKNARAIAMEQEMENM